MNHPDKISGFDGSIEEAATNVAQMRYDCVIRFINAFAEELKRQSVGDKKRGREQLSFLLNVVATNMGYSAKIMQKIWKLCAKHMPP